MIGELERSCVDHGQISFERPDLPVRHNEHGTVQARLRNVAAHDALGHDLDVDRQRVATGCLIGDVALPLLERGRPVQSFATEGGWSAPGDGIREYLDANQAWLEESMRSGARAHLGSLSKDGGSFLGTGAWVSGSVDPRCSIIGSGAIVEGEGRLERVVVWPGARVTAPLRDAVVTTEGRIVSRPAE